MPSGRETVTISFLAGVQTWQTPRNNYGQHSPSGSGVYRYVDWNSGDDTRTGLNPTNSPAGTGPKKTFSATMPLFNPGDVIIAYAGNYLDPFTITRGGTAANPVWIEAKYHSDTGLYEDVQINQPLGWQSTHSAPTIKYQGGSCHHVHLHRLRIFGAKGQAGAPADDKFNFNGVSFHNGAGYESQIINCEIALALHCGIKDMNQAGGNGTNRLKFEGNIIRDNGQLYNNSHGMYMHDAADVICRGNLAAYNAAWGLHFDSDSSGGPPRSNVYNNIMYHNAHDNGLHGGGDGIWAHNVCIASGRGGIELFRSGTINNLFANNVCSDNPESQFRSDTAGSTGGVPNQPLGPGNSIDYNIMNPFSPITRAYDNYLATYSPAIIGANNALVVPTFENAPGNSGTISVWLSAGSAGRTPTLSVTMNGAPPQSVKGLFNADQYDTAPPPPGPGEIFTQLTQQAIETFGVSSVFAYLSQLAIEAYGPITSPVQAVLTQEAVEQYGVETVRAFLTSLVIEQYGPWQVFGDDKLPRLR